MKHFSQLFSSIDQTTKTNVKVEALVHFFNEADDKDSIWAIALFSHKRPKRTVSTTLLREWAAEYASLPLWLFEESYHIVGDLAETIALLIPPGKVKVERPLHYYVEEIIKLEKKEEEEKKAFILKCWQELDVDGRFLFNKLITGGFRVGVSQKLITRGLAKAENIDEQVLAHRLMGNWDPLKTSLEELIRAENEADIISRPYPFYLAYALDQEVEKMGEIKDWFVERKWDGIRGQIISREGQIFIWSRGEELMTDKFPEFEVLRTQEMTDYVIDGEIICYKDGALLPFNALQTRIGRKNVSKKHLKEYPVVIIAYDILEYKKEDLRELPMYERRQLLENLVLNLTASGVVLLSDLVKCKDWEEAKKEREAAKLHKAEGLMIKKVDSTYKVGRKRGEWWKWKVDPMTVDAVMIYAQRGHGRRANLYTDFTFAVWNEEGKLVPFTKAYSGLTDAEFNKITRWVRKNTIEKFGPVCSVKPELVFELAFEGISLSKRHKSGIALRFPRMKRWRQDKPAEEADRLSTLMGLL